MNKSEHISLDSYLVKLPIRTSSRHKCDICKIRFFVAILPLSLHYCHLLSSQHP